MIVRGFGGSDCQRVRSASLFASRLDRRRNPSRYRAHYRRRQTESLSFSNVPPRRSGQGYRTALSGMTNVQREEMHNLRIEQKDRSVRGSVSSQASRPPDDCDDCDHEGDNEACDARIPK
jgi:hypothetical protein